MPKPSSRPKKEPKNGCNKTLYLLTNVEVLLQTVSRVPRNLFKSMLTLHLMTWGEVGLTIYFLILKEILYSFLGRTS
jgi:hypothetical protein